MLHYGKVGYRVVGKAGDNGWDIRRSETKYGQRRKNHVDSTLFPTRFDGVAHDLGYGRGRSRRTNATRIHFV